MLTIFDQRVLDAVCDRVARRLGHGLVNWSVGKREVAVAVVARSLKSSRHAVRAAISRLVDGGYLLDSFVTDDDYERRIDDEIGVPHQGWQAYSRFDERAALSAWGYESLEEWLDWDGVDGSPLGGFGAGPFHVPLSIEVVRLPSKDYEVLWRNKVIWVEAYNDEPHIPRTVGRIAADSRTVEEFVCRLISYLATFPSFDLDYVETLARNTRKGWRNGNTAWADLLTWYWRNVESADEPTDFAEVLIQEIRRFQAELRALAWD